MKKFVCLFMAFLLIGALLTACGDTTPSSPTNAPGTPGGDPAGTPDTPNTPSTPNTPGTTDEPKAPDTQNPPPQEEDPVQDLGGGVKQYVFEAEYTDVEDIMGTGWSGAAYGTAVICPDNKNGGASNGYYISYLYSEDTRVYFEITSDRAVSNAELFLRVSGEVADFTLNYNEYTVLVNGTQCAFDDIEFKNIPATTAKTMLPFFDVDMGAVSLKEGLNTIELITTNDILKGGTMTAQAPLVDCIKIHTEAELTWDPITDNLEGK